VHVQVLRQAFEEEEFDGEELRSITKKALRKMLGRTPGLEAAGQTEALAEAVLQEREALIAQQQPPPPRQQQQSAAAAAAAEEEEEEEEGMSMVCPPSAH
jgi:biotin carboxyl carrier protein